MGTPGPVCQCPTGFAGEFELLFFVRLAVIRGGLDELRRTSLDPPLGIELRVKP